MADVLEDAQHYSYSDYLRFPKGTRCELIDGEIFMMSSPSDWHQAMVVELCRQLSNFFHGKSCRVRVAPFDVRLFP
ncbi:MAG: Uma2 family endonuclease, partial [Treponema sp.]|nr:Uma2 family endonuclease [Treponema sp.]